MDYIVASNGEQAQTQSSPVDQRTGNGMACGVIKCKHPIQR